MEEEKLNKASSRKSSSVNGENGKEIVDKSDGGGEVALKAKMSLMNGITVIVGSIIGLYILHLLLLKSICMIILDNNVESNA